MERELAGPQHPFKDSRRGTPPEPGPAHRQEFEQAG